jgi:AraC-like DNA-binding protein
MLLVAVDFVVMSLVTVNILGNYEFLDYLVFPVFSIYVLSIAFLSVYRPELLFREQNNTDDAINIVKLNALTSKNAIPTLHNQEAADQKIRYLELDESLAQNLMEELATIMEEQQVYRQNELSLPDLAKSLGISVHQLSELLNVHLGLSFYDYINSRRLEYASNLLKNPDCHLRILDIAFEAGFNNKNSFYRAFKENFGFTPNQYRERFEEHELKTI